MRAANDDIFFNVYEVSGLSVRGYDTKVRVEATSLREARLSGLKRLAKVTKVVEVK